jgi:hypothetical protein
MIPNCLFEKFILKIDILTRPVIPEPDLKKPGPTRPVKFWNRDSPIRKHHH